MKKKIRTDVECIAEQTGLYLDNCQFAKAAPHATDPAIADRLWSLSEELVNEKFTL